MVGAGVVVEEEVELLVEGAKLVLLDELADPMVELNDDDGGVVELELLDVAGAGVVVVLMPEVVEILQLAPLYPSRHSHDPSRPRHRPLLLQLTSALHPPLHPVPYTSASHASHPGPEKPSLHPEAVEILQLAPLYPA